MKQILSSILLFFLFPIISLAISYDIDQYYINAQVLENGDMQVAEIILLNGTFNGYERDILYQNSYTDSNLNATDLSDLEVYGLNIDKITFDTFKDNFVKFEQVNLANNGDSAKYILSSLDGGYRIRMYKYTNRGKTAFLIKYTLEDIVIMHDDFAEVYWNFIGSDFADSINDLQIRVSLPSKDSSNKFYHWVHGDVSGESKVIDNENKTMVIAETPLNPAYQAVDVRMVFDKSLVNDLLISKYSDQTLDEILDYEQKLYEENEKLRQEIKTKWYIAVGATITFYVILVVAIIYIYFKYDKERKPKFNLKYNREFIDDYNVEVVDYLMNHNITENALSASIMNLIYKKNINVENLGNKKNDYKFILNNKDNLNATEIALVDFLFNTIGNSQEFTTKELKAYASSPKTCQTFMATYTRWKNMVINDGKKEKFFEEKSNFIIWPFILLLYAIILVIFISSNNIELILGTITIGFTIAFLIYCLAFTKKTEKGIEHFTKWQAFKNFLNDFGNFSIKELPEVVLWERYLVYATVFGLADKVEKVMNVKIKEFTNINDIDYFTLNYITNIHIANLITSSMHSAINSSQATINRITAGSSHGSNGFGGGFSGGGGFGGGGGGGRGF